MIPMMRAFTSAAPHSSIVDPAISKSIAWFRVGPGQAEWVMTGYLPASGIFMFTPGPAQFSLYWNNNILTAARIIQAAGGGAIMPVTMAMKYTLVRGSRIGMAPAAGQTLGGYLIDNFTWQMIFTIDIPIGIMTVILGGLSPPDTTVRPGLTFDVPGATLSCLGCFAILPALRKGQTFGWTFMFVVITVMAQIFAMTMFVLWKLSGLDPLLNIHLKRKEVFSTSLAAVGAIYIGLFATVFLIPSHARGLPGYTPVQAGLLLMPRGLAMGLMMPVTASGMNAVPGKPAGEASALTRLVRHVAASAGIVSLDLCPAVAGSISLPVACRDDNGVVPGFNPPVGPGPASSRHRCQAGPCVPPRSVIGHHGGQRRYLRWRP